MDRSSQRLLFAMLGFITGILIVILVNIAVFGVKVR